MIEEKILDKLRKMLYHTQKANECGLSNNDFKEDIEALEGILDLYNKEKEKNKELENADLTSVYLDGVYDGEKKYKDKIKAKIQYLEKLEFGNDLVSQWTANVTTISILKGLLEE